MHSGNKGEWSELYAFFYLLGRGLVYLADADLNKLGPDDFLKIISVIREEQKNQPISYICGDDVQIVSDAGFVLGKVPAVEFCEAADAVYQAMKQGNKNGTLEVPEIEEFMEIIGVEKLKAPSADKADMAMITFDPITSSELETRWSIKSQMGNSSTLLNASGATNFHYSVSLSDEQVREINAIDSRGKVLDRTQAVLERSKAVIFDRVSNSVFDRNMKLIDLEFPRMMAYALLVSFGNNMRSCAEVVAELERIDPLNLGADLDGMYTFKFKRFLAAVALGMFPAKRWDGRDDATGGYLIVRSNGEVVAFHIYNRNQFEDYLLEHTVFETPSMSRHGFGEVVSTRNGYEFSLNLQLRFDA